LLALDFGGPVLHASGEPVKTIAETLGVSAATIYRVVAQD
jgi:transposase